MSHMPTKMPTKRKLMVDVDTGVDDAQALILALSRPDVDVIAVTCVTGNVNLEFVYRNTLRVLRVMGRLDVPVYKGASLSLLGKGACVDLHHGTDGLGNVPDDSPVDETLVQEDHAVSALLRLTKEHPGEVTLVALGPLTNIALAIRMDPGFGKRLKNAVIMGGNIEGVGNITQSAEFNFSCDPEAAHVVLNELACPLQLVTWEVCLRHGTSWEWYEMWSNTGTDKGRFMKMIDAHTVHRKRNIYHYEQYYSCDPTAMAVAIEPETVLESKTAYCSVELAGQLTRGQVVVDWRGKLTRPPNTSLITKMHVPRHLELYEEMLK